MIAEDYRKKPAIPHPLRSEPRFGKNQFTLFGGVVVGPGRTVIVTLESIMSNRFATLAGP
jgi:hypothetical protein